MLVRTDQREQNRLFLNPEDVLQRAAQQSITVAATQNTPFLQAADRERR
jgi:hypothetical protein